MRKLVKKRVVQVKEPVAVYDVTNLSGKHNFCVGKNNLVLHNCAKTGDKALESEEIIMILGAIGFDPKAADPVSKLQVGKIICLADPDPRP